jgi:hypothetical protein
MIVSTPDRVVWHGNEKMHSHCLFQYLCILFLIQTANSITAREICPQADKLWSKE